MILKTILIKLVVNCLNAMIKPIVNCQKIFTVLRTMLIEIITKSIDISGKRVNLLIEFTITIGKSNQKRD